MILLSTSKASFSYFIRAAACRTADGTTEVMNRISVDAVVCRGLTHPVRGAYNHLAIQMTLAHSA